MGQALPAAQSSPDTPGQGATYHRAPPQAPGGSRVLHLVPGALLLGAAAGLWRYGHELPLEDETWELVREPHSALLAFVGAIFLAQGVSAILRVMLRGSGASFRPRARWKREWTWRREGVPDPLAERVRDRFVSVVLAVAAAAPGAWLFYRMDVTWNRFTIGILLSPAAILLLVALVDLVRLKVRGSGRLRFRTYPFAIGGTMKATYVPSSRMTGYGARMHATLRCVEVAGKSAGGRIAARERWKWTEDVELKNGAVEIALEISAPLDLATRMGKRFWELEVGPWSQGAAGNATFVVPVYVDPDLRIAAKATLATPVPAPSPRRPLSEPPKRKPASSPPARPKSNPPARKPASNPPARPTSRPPMPAATPSGRLDEAPPPAPRLEQPGAQPAATPTPVGIPVELVGDPFRIELLLTPALSPEDLVDRVEVAFGLALQPLPGAEAGSWFGRCPGLELALSIGEDGRRLILGGTRPMDPGPGEVTDRASEWAVAQLVGAGVAARRPA